MATRLPRTTTPSRLRRTEAFLHKPSAVTRYVSEVLLLFTVADSMRLGRGRRRWGGFKVVYKHIAVLQRLNAALRLVGMSRPWFICYMVRKRDRRITKDSLLGHGIVLAVFSHQRTFLTGCPDTAGLC